MREHVGKERDHSRALWTLLVLAVWMDDVMGAARPAAVRVAG